MDLDIVLSKIKRLIPKKIFKALQPFYHYLLSLLAAAVYRFPSEEMIVIGVTGTTGKTTTVCLIAEMLQKAGYRTGYTSTAVLSDGGKVWLNDKKMTMSGRFFMQKILRQMVDNRCRYAIVETSSEGIRQYRHKFINYDVLVFTGLYPEHIESHGSFEKYKEAKGRLFAHLRKCRIKYIDGEKQAVKSPSALKSLELERKKKAIIVNGDDEHAGYFLSFWAERKTAFTASRQVDFGKDVEVLSYRPREVEEQTASFQINNTEISTRLLGGFNAVNGLCAFCAGREENLPLAKIKSGLESAEGIPGRLEKIDEGQNFIVIVDYAFEPRAVEKLYDTANRFPHNRIIHVFGSCGGGRDVARRPALGKLIGANSDIAIITNEDPYDDDPEIIMGQVSFGAEQAGKKPGVDLFKILDRREAIRKALQNAKEGDIVLITGKGSEQFISLAAGKKMPWDDRTAVRELLKGMR